jgi:hypothetical protein
MRVLRNEAMRFFTGASSRSNSRAARSSNSTRQIIPAQDFFERDATPGLLQSLAQDKIVEIIFDVFTDRTLDNRSRRCFRESRYFV